MPVAEPCSLPPFASLILPVGNKKTANAVFLVEVKRTMPMAEPCSLPPFASLILPVGNKKTANAVFLVEVIGLEPMTLCL